ncbi:TetR/AcrR family transcriptional regulator [Halalkalibacter sp. APA_J-10(15)]|uniref:TetR/AcrR family transcriptional regulator n=1 Tax=Halalkalibacter sp. APA_J-10(15) TaxID=2933805 RepID=UPI001FF27801|nr:TetR/AcrR family transcriptional regulator [Halalkalibacter sp. APA_J-10(15)]MCK0471203.1 TetR/AcrR family transcriptional regulator [Halalkalibacter sp. APA_J-10(15)]
MNGFEKRKQKKIKQIYNACFHLMTKHGFSKVNVNEIAELANVSPATIFNYFETKENLYENMMNHWIDQILADYEHILYSQLPFNQKLKELFTHESVNLKKAASIKGHDSSVSPLTFIYSNNEEKFISFYLKLVALGKEEGYISSHYSNKVLLRYLNMYLHEFIQLSVQNENEDSDIDQLLELFFYGLTGNKVISFEENDS